MEKNGYARWIAMHDAERSSYQWCRSIFKYKEKGMVDIIVSNQNDTIHNIWIQKYKRVSTATTLIPIRCSFGCRAFYTRGTWFDYFTWFDRSPITVKTRTLWMQPKKCGQSFNWRLYCIRNENTNDYYSSTLSIPTYFRAYRSPLIWEIQGDRSL